MGGALVRRWRLVVEYGPTREEIGAVTLSATEAVADEAARALLSVMARVARESGRHYRVSVRMDVIDEWNRLE